MPTKAGTAYVDIVGNFAPLNRQIARLDGISAQASKGFSRSMKVVSREADNSRRKVARLTREISDIGGAAQVSSRQTARAMRQIEVSSGRALRALRTVEAAQKRVAVGAQPAASRARQVGVGGGQSILHPTAAALIPVISRVAVEAAVATAARQAASRIATSGVSRTVTSASGMGRSFGSGATTSTAGGRVFSSSGLSLGKSFAGSFVKGLGPGLAIAGVERILTSALSGDMKGAGFEAGGALIGGILGSFGGPAGAMLGAGLGTFAGDLIEGLFDSGKKTMTLQQRLAASAKQVTFAYRGLRASSVTLARSGDAVVRSHSRARKSSREVAAAERQLARVRRQFGPNSKQAAQAEQHLSGVRRRSAIDSKSAQRAERLHGIERKGQMKILKGTILEERHYLNQLQKNEKQLRKEYAAAVKNERSHQVLIHLKGKLAKNQKDLTDTQKKQNATLREASQTIGPKYAKFLRESSGLLLRTGKSARVTRKDLEGPFRAFANFGKAGEAGTRRAKGSIDRLKGSMGRLGNEAKSQMSKASNSMRDFSRVTTSSMGNVKGQAKQAMIIFGQPVPSNWSQKQKGGAIVPGKGEGDTFPTALPVGSFVLNKKATTAFGFQRGGSVPVMLEPGERVFMPHEVSRVGPRRLQEMNTAVPRFQSGGEVGGTARMVLPQILGPEPLRTLGQKAVEKVFEAAVKLLRREGGTHTVAAVLKEANRIDGLRLPYVWGGGHQSTPAPANGPFDCSGAVSRLLQGAGFNIPTMVSGGFETFGEAGKGKVSVLANPEHVYAVIGGRAWGTSKENPGGGAGWINGYTYRSGFAVRHADVMDLKVVRGPNSSKGQPLKKGMQLGGWVKTGYTTYDVDGPGAYGNLMKGMGYAELGTATSGGAGTGMGFIARALGRPGELPSEFPLEVKVGSIGKAATLFKRDRGYGQGDPYYSIDIHHLAWPAVGLSGNSKGTAWVRPANGKGAATGSAGGGEKVPPVYKGCRTALLSFPAIPKELPAIEREIEKRRKEVGKYRRAESYASEKDKRPLVAAALRKNVEALEDQLTKLREARYKARVEKAKKALTKGLKRKLGKVAGYEQRIEGLGRAFDIGTQEADQIVALEPQPTPPPPKATEKQKKEEEDEYVKRFTTYVNTDERNAYARLLDRAADWRNEILKAEYFGFDEKNPSVVRMQNTWEGKVDHVVKTIDHINAFTEKVRERVARWRRNHKNKEFPEWLKKQIRERDQMREKLPWLRFKEDELRKAVGGARGHFFPGGERANGEPRIKPPPTPLPGSGTLEETLNEVQGVHWPDGWHHQLLPASALAPPRVAGRFGGVIWDVQTSIEELGLKIRDAASGIEGSEPSDEEDSERKELEEELLKQANQRTAVAEAQFATLRDFNATYPVGQFPPYAGKAHSGAVVPGPPHQERTMIVRGQERIRTPEQELAMAEKIRRQAGGDGAALPQLIVNGNIVQEPGDTRDPVEAVINDRRFPVAVRQVAMGGRVTPGGARS